MHGFWRCALYLAVLGVAAHPLGQALVATMNAGELYTFFRLRTCTRAQWEIRAIAVEALHVLRKAHPLLFALYGPTCFMTGHCPEGKMCCGRQAEIRQQFQ